MTLLSALVGLALLAPFQDSQSSAKALLAKIDEYKPPVYEEEKNDPDYKRDWMMGFLRYLEKRNDMISEFVTHFPDHERSKGLMEEWFKNLAGGVTPTTMLRIPKAVVSIDSFLLNNKVDWITSMGAYYRSYYVLCGPWNRLIELDRLKAPPDDRERRQVIQIGMAAIQEFIDKFPDDIRGARLYDILATASHDPVSSRAIYSKVINEYPDHPNVGFFQGKLNQTDKIGDPFAFEFEDGTTGEKVVDKDYAGKVLLVVFTAVALKPCQKELLEAKRLWFRYEHEGMEVIDVSLDLPSEKKKYVDFVGDNKLKWRHYFQGNGYLGEFSFKWGINTFPTWFLVDRKGNLRYSNAEDDTETKIKELLKEKA
ncbi:MAG: redoxin domain-containing protein [Armatimonadetes bacterium]|nr:redoxin domain-containing protein [Armatimonadota bacterium]